MINLNGGNTIITRREYEALDRQRSLRKAGQPKPRKIEVISTVIKGLGCYDASFCPKCRMCNNPLVLPAVLVCPKSQAVATSLFYDLHRSL